MIAAGAAAAGWVALVSLADLLGPALLLDRDPAWAAPRLLLGLACLAAAAATCAVAAGLFVAVGELSIVAGPLTPLPFPRAALAAAAALALGAGAFLRLRAVEEIPFPLFHDELLTLPAAAALSGGPADFRDAIRGIWDDAGRASGSVGVVYLELWRAFLKLCGTTVLGVRLPSLFGGLLSLATGAALGRALLPAGGGALTALVLAGLRWHVILTRWSWVMIVLVPIADLATLAALRARRRGSRGAAFAAGALAGLGAQVYLAGWIVGAALALFLAWPRPDGRPRGRGVVLAVAGFALAAAPLFVLRAGREAPYLVRARNHNVFAEMRVTRSLRPLAHATRDALVAPWGSDPIPRNDLPGHARLPLPVAVPLALACARAAARPREDLSALFLAHAAVAFATCAAWGEVLLANGSRFAYLTSVAAVGAAAGTLVLVGALPAPRRRVAAILLGGALAVPGARAIRELDLWDADRSVYVDLVGQHTTVGRAAVRWQAYGALTLERSPEYARLTPEIVRRYRVVPRRDLRPDPPPGPRGPRAFRLCAPETPRRSDERVVERVRDAWGTDWAVVYGRRAAAPPGAGGS